MKNIALKINVPNVHQTSLTDEKVSDEEKDEDDEEADLYIFEKCHSEPENVRDMHTKGMKTAKKWLSERTNEVKEDIWQLYSAKKGEIVTKKSEHDKVIFFFLKICRIFLERSG